MLYAWWVVGTFSNEHKYFSLQVSRKILTTYRTDLRFWNTKLYCDSVLCLVEILAIKLAALEFCQTELETMHVFKEEVLGLRFTYNDMKTILSNEHRVCMNSQVKEVYCM